MINKNFTLLWLGKIISQLGDKFYGIALAWWILKQTDSPSVMGFFLLLSALPAILFGFFSGALTDRTKRKTMLIVTDVIRGALTLAVTGLSLAGLLEVWQVFVIGFCLSVTTAFYEPAVQAIIPDMVPAEKLPKANGLSQMVSGVCTVAGPLLGALTVSLFGITSVFFANSVSYLISALLSSFLTAAQPLKTAPKGGNLLRDICEGIRFVKNQRKITQVLKVIATAHLFMGGLSVLLPFLANGLTGSGVNNLGALEMMMGVGLITGSVLMGIRKTASVTARPLFYLIAAMGAGFLGISVLQLLTVQTVYPYLPVMVGVGASVACASVLWQSLLQRSTPPEMAGRVFGLSTLIANTSLPLANALFGVLLGVTSISLLAALCGVGLVLVCVILLLQKNYDT